MCAPAGRPGPAASASAVQWGYFGGAVRACRGQVRNIADGRPCPGLQPRLWHTSDLQARPVQVAACSTKSLRFPPAAIPNTLLRPWHMGGLMHAWGHCVAMRPLNAAVYFVDVLCRTCRVRAAAQRYVCGHLCTCDEARAQRAPRHGDMWYAHALDARRTWPRSGRGGWWSGGGVAQRSKAGCQGGFMLGGVAHERAAGENREITRDTCGRGYCPISTGGASRCILGGWKRRGAAQQRVHGRCGAPGVSQKHRIGGTWATKCDTCRRGFCSISRSGLLRSVCGRRGR